ncbi:hypothetical protein Ndes2526B_g07912 [Nannochloris sp. 'desiccata']
MQALNMVPAMQNQGLYHQQRCNVAKPLVLGLPSHHLYRPVNEKHVVTAAVAASTVVEQALQAEAQSLQKGLDASILDIRQAAETFDASTALQQVQTGIENTVTKATAPFDVFSGNWSLNLLLFGIAFLVAYSIATGPKQ